MPGAPNDPGKFHIPHGVAIDACDRVWVADRMNNRTQVFTLSGKWLASWTCMAEPPYGLRMFGESKEGGGVVPRGQVLVTGGGSGAAVDRPGFVNRLEVLSFNQDCDNVAVLGDCSVE